MSSLLRPLSALDGHSVVLVRLAEKRSRFARPIFNLTGWLPCGLSRQCQSGRASQRAFSSWLCVTSVFTSLLPCPLYIQLLNFLSSKLPAPLSNPPAILAHCKIYVVLVFHIYIYINSQKYSTIFQMFWMGLSTSSAH